MTTYTDLLDDGWTVVTVESPLTPNGFTPGSELKGSTLAAIASALSFPEHFGGNLDALADSLRDLSSPTLLVWEHWWWLARADPDAFTAIRQILARRAAEGGFAAVLSGSGPPIDLPRLG